MNIVIHSNNQFIVSCHGSWTICFLWCAKLFQITDNSETFTKCTPSQVDTLYQADPDLGKVPNFD